MSAIVLLCGRAAVRSLLLPGSLASAGGHSWLGGSGGGDYYCDSSAVDDPSWVLAAVHRAVAGRGAAAAGGGGGSGARLPREITFAAGTAEGYAAAKLLAGPVFEQCKV